MCAYEAGAMNNAVCGFRACVYMRQVPMEGSGSVWGRLEACACVRAEDSSGAGGPGGCELPRVRSGSRSCVSLRTVSAFNPFLVFRNF